MVGKMREINYLIISEDSLKRNYYVLSRRNWSLQHPIITKQQMKALVKPIPLGEK